MSRRRNEILQLQQEAGILPANSGAEDPVAAAAQYGRGCRVRRETHFLEDEVGFAPPAASQRSTRSTYPAESVIFNRRYPEREAAKTAIERLHRMEADEEEEILLPPPRAHNSKSKTNAKRRRSPSVDEDMQATESSSDDTVDSASTDSSVGIVPDEQTKNVERALLRSKRQSLGRLVGDMLQDHPSSSSNHHHPHRQQKPSDKFREDGGEGTNGADGTAVDAETLGDISPLPIDPSITFDRIGGMPEHVLTLREMVMIPMLYPSLMSELRLQPPRGVLFVGPPGTGKTMMARALANEAQQISSQLHGKNVSFFMRKGADILSKWVGESEKQLRLLFDEARKRQPSIIFFDEIDGLAPVRHSKQEQSHAALVSTLLALMDGLDDRGQVVVIGATNRPDTIDPALRRPGRFDRELRFPVPDAASRRHIVALHTKELPIAAACREQVMDYLVAESEGWSGADIKAVCTEASLLALRRALPQIFLSRHRLQLPTTVANGSTLITAPSIGLDEMRGAVARLQPSMQRSRASSSSSASPACAAHFLATLKVQADHCLQQVRQSWDPAARAHRRSQMHCEDLVESFRLQNSGGAGSSSSSIVPRGLLLILAADDAFIVEQLGRAVSHQLSQFFSVHASLRRLLLEGEDPMSSAVAAAPRAAEDDGVDLAAAVGASTGPAALCHTLRMGSPSVLLLRDAPVAMAEWHRQSEEDRLSATTLQFELKATLDENEVLVVVPCRTQDVEQVAQSVAGCSVSQLEAEGLAVVVSNAVSVVPTAANTAAWAQYLVTTAATAWSTWQASRATWEDLPIDDRPPPPAPVPKKTAEDRAKERQLWHRVEYKRRQLRHMLSRWLSQFIENRKFQLLCDANLDLETTHPLRKAWEKHTLGKRIGLNEIMEKLENEEYHTLSQYVEDVEQLCSNVRTFFTNRSAFDQRYRHRAMELRETTILNMYKIHRNVVKFCEDHKAMSEPVTTDDEERDTPQKEASNDASPAARSATPKSRPKARKSWSGGRRKRRQPKPKPNQADSTSSSESSGSDDEPSDPESHNVSRSLSTTEGSSVTILSADPNAKSPSTGKQQQQQATMHSPSSSHSFTLFHDKDKNNMSASTACEAIQTAVHQLPWLQLHLITVKALRWLAHIARSFTLNEFVQTIVEAAHSSRAKDTAATNPV